MWGFPHKCGYLNYQRRTMISQTSIWTSTHLKKPIRYVCCCSLNSGSHCAFLCFPVSSNWLLPEPREKMAQWLPVTASVWNMDESPGVGSKESAGQSAPPAGHPPSAGLKLWAYSPSHLHRLCTQNILSPQPLVSVPLIPELVLAGLPGSLVP